MNDKRAVKRENGEIQRMLNVFQDLQLFQGFNLQHLSLSHFLNLDMFSLSFIIYYLTVQILQMKTKEEQMVDDEDMIGASLKS